MSENNVMIADDHGCAVPPSAGARRKPKILKPAVASKAASPQRGQAEELLPEAFEGGLLPPIIWGPNAFRVGRIRP